MKIRIVNTPITDRMFHMKSNISNISKLILGTNDSAGDSTSA